MSTTLSGVTSQARSRILKEEDENTASASETANAQTETTTKTLARGSSRSADAVDSVSTTSATTSASSTSTRDTVDLDAHRDLPASDSTVRAETPDSAALSDYMARTADGTAGLMWQELMEMAKDSAADQTAAADLRNALQTSKVGAKQGQINAQERENAASRDDAATQLGFATAGALLTFAMVKDDIGNSTASEGASTRAAVAQTIPDLTGKLGQYVSATSGAKKAENKAKVDQTRQQLMEQQYDQAIDGAKSSYDEAREQTKLAVRILTEHSERQTQISATITRV